MTSGYNQLRRPLLGRRIAGVAAGIAEYFRIDVALVRVLWLLSIFLGGGGILAYIIAWIAIPEEESAPSGAFSGTDSTGSSGSATADSTGSNDTSTEVHPTAQHGSVSRNNGLSYLGLFLILAGIWLLLKTFFPWRLSLYTWPVFLIGLGIVLLIPHRPRS